jgi:hypothetical protein
MILPDSSMNSALIVTAGEERRAMVYKCSVMAAITPRL